MKATAPFKGKRRGGQICNGKQHWSYHELTENTEACQSLSVTHGIEKDTKPK